MNISKLLPNLVFAGVMIVVAVGVWWILSPEAENKPGALFFPDNAQIVAKGEGMYVANCASCHGANLEGQPDWKNRDASGLMPAPPHDESGHTWHHTDKMLFDLTKFGLAKTANLEDYQTNMPVYETLLSDDEIIAVLSYIKSTWPEEIRLRHDQMNAQVAEAEGG